MRNQETRAGQRRCLGQALACPPRRRWTQGSGRHGREMRPQGIGPDARRRDESQEKVHQDRRDLIHRGVARQGQGECCEYCAGSCGYLRLGLRGCGCVWRIRFAQWTQCCLMEITHSRPASPVRVGSREGFSKRHSKPACRQRRQGGFSAPSQRIFCFLHAF